MTYVPDPIPRAAWKSLSPEVAAQTIRFCRDSILKGLGDKGLPHFRFLDGLSCLVEEAKITPDRARRMAELFLEGCLVAGDPDAPAVQQDQGITVAAMCCFEAGINPDWITTGQGERFMTPEHFPDVFPDDDDDLDEEDPDDISDDPEAPEEGP